MHVHATKQTWYDCFCTRLEVARKAVGDEETLARLIVIAFGAGKFSSTLKHNRPVPTTRLRRELECRFRVVLVDEHRTLSFYYQMAECHLANERWSKRDGGSVVGCHQHLMLHAHLASRRQCGDEHPSASACSVAPHARCTCGVTTPS
jgi:hypothetical protein